MRIHSPVKAIRDLIINPWRDGVAKNVVNVMFKFECRDMWMCITKDGAVYMKGAKSDNYDAQYPLHDYNLHAVIMLGELKAISADDCRKHLEAVADVKRLRQRGWNAEKIIANAKELKIKLTVHQLKKLRAIMLEGNIADCKAQPQGRYHKGELIVWEVPQ